jgi:hypothetical protein
VGLFETALEARRKASLNPEADAAIGDILVTLPTPFLSETSNTIPVGNIS